MLSLRLATAPVTFKLPPPSHSHQLFPSSTFGNHATFNAVLTDYASQSQADDRPPLRVSTCHFKEVNSLTTDTQLLPFLARPLLKNNQSDAWDDSNAPPNASPCSAINYSGLPPTPFPGPVFPVHGPFDLMYCIQTGGFGAAWAAKDRSTGRLLCLKMYQPLQDPNVLRSVRTELNTFKRMVKSNRGERGRQFIMELSRSIQHGVQVYFAMELMATDLASYFSAEPERCKLHARRWMAQMALGIQSLHEMAIVHRDIKSENILIDTRENIRIIDFGLAHLGREGPKEFLGTPSYMAPEVLRNKGMSAQCRQPYGSAVDWWALGCILFELESQGHQILFDAEENVHAYVAWTQRSCRAEQIYPRFENLDSAVADLLDGLLQVEHSARYFLSEIERHRYFLRPDGTSEFDDAAARALARPIRPELVPRSAPGHGPIKVIEGAKPGSAYDWTNLKWALTNGQNYE